MNSLLAAGALAAPYIVLIILLVLLVAAVAAYIFLYIRSKREAKNSAIAAADAEEGENKDDLHGESLGDKVKALSPGATVAKRFFRSKLSVIGLVTIIVLFVFAFVGPLFSPWGESDPDLSSTDPKVSGNLYSYTIVSEDGTSVDYQSYYVSYDWQDNMAMLEGVSANHWMGTDNLGRDVLTRLMYGGRISLTIGFVVVLLETLLGVVLGGLAGYFGGWVDNVLMRIVDLLSCIPTIPLLIILGTALDALGLTASIWKLYIEMATLCLIGWVGTARLVRGQILSLREQEFMLAAKCSGLSTRSKIFKHLLPNVIPQLIVSMTMGLGSIILMEATLGFLGIGAPLETATWGTLINAASKQKFRQFYPNMWIGSGICITLAILAFNFVGDGLRDAFDPKMKR